MTKIILAHELLEAGISKSQVAKHLGVSRRTITRWSQAIEERGSLDALLGHYQQAKKCTRQKRKTDVILKRRICALREKHYHGCGQKIQYFLENDMPTSYLGYEEHMFTFSYSYVRGKIRTHVSRLRKLVVYDPTLISWQCRSF